jgi:serine protease Do
VLKVGEADLPVAPLGNSDDILVCEWALEVGNPFDWGPIVRNLGRDIPEPQGEYGYRDMIQTDAAINPGNSGGPLANADGEVVGINSFINTGGDYTINTARSFLDEIRLHGQVLQSWTGIIALQDITRPLAEDLALDSIYWALVVKIAMGSPAEVAGLESGDVITAIGGEKIQDTDEVIDILRGLRVGEVATLDVVRHNEHYTLDLLIEKRPRHRMRR